MEWHFMVARLWPVTRRVGQPPVRNRCAPKGKTAAIEPNLGKGQRRGSPRNTTPPHAAAVVSAHQ
jgi:hypothetical protein